MADIPSPDSTNPVADTDTGVDSMGMGKDDHWGSKWAFSSYDLPLDFSHSILRSREPLLMVSRLCGVA